MQFLAGVLLALGFVAGAQAADPALLTLESKIPLGAIHGRIDHLAIDVHRRRLYVAELGNDSVGVVDLNERRTARTLTGLKGPQGVGYVPSADTLYVANAGDGTVLLFEGSSLRPLGKMTLGDDADNVRVDDAAHRVYVGYGSGALAVIDTASRHKIADIPLKAHPESFQLDRSGRHIFVNVPDAQEIALVDRATNKQISSWPLSDLHANFPMALDEEGGRVLIVFRHPARLEAFARENGAPLASADTCADSDDLFVDAKRHRIYVICGQGFVDVFSQRSRGYVRIAHVPTVAGARTALFSPELDRLYVTARAVAGEPAAIRVLRPAD